MERATILLASSAVLLLVSLGAAAQRRWPVPPLLVASALAAAVGGIWSALEVLGYGAGPWWAKHVPSYAAPLLLAAEVVRQRAAME